MSGFFVSFEGSEGCGKSTQIALLRDTLRAAGREALLVREPGGTAIGETIRQLLQHDPKAAAMAPETELLLFAASRAQLVREVIQPALAADRIVVADRFLDSTTVYQGVARAMPAEAVRAINAFAAGARLPDRTYVLDMDAGEAMRRARAGRSAPSDRMESEAPAFYEAVRHGYLALAAGEPRRFRILDATQPSEAIAAAIRRDLATTQHALLEGIGA